MKISLPQFTIVLIVTTIISLTSMEAKAQSSLFETLFHGGTYNNDQELQAMYTSNAQRPLGGLFAPGFTRTMTFLGGVNFPSDSVSEIDFESVPSPLAPLINNIAQPSRELDESGYALSFAFGRRHSRTLRSEIEVAFRSNDINLGSNSSNFQTGLSSALIGEDGSVNATSAMKNFIREFQNTTLFTPYVGVGIGLSYIDIEFGEADSATGESTFQDGAGAFTYQAIGGVATKLNAFSDFVIEYRFLGTSEIEFDSLNDSVAYNTSTLFLGVAFEY